MSWTSPEPDADAEPGDSETSEAGEQRHQRLGSAEQDPWREGDRYARRLRPDSRLGPWLFTVARHVHASYCRSRLLEDSHAGGLLGLWPHGRPGQSPFEAVKASETGRRMATARASLPLAYREALLLVVVEGLRHSEAAEICGVTAEAMRRAPCTSS